MPTGFTNYLHNSTNVVKKIIGGILMALKGWDNSFSVNHTTMDSDHKQLVLMISDLHEAMRVGQSKMVIEKLVKDLSHYSVNHFSREEQYLKESKHPDLDAQMQQHALFLNKVTEFKNNVDNGQPSIAIKMLPFLNDWFLNHIMKIDMKYK